MDNYSIIKILDTVADIYEVLGENRFRVRSYRNGAQTVEGLDIELSALLAKKGEAGITALAGIGKGLAGKIVELISTGRCVSIEELLAKTPPGLLDILKLNGMGPKKTGFIYRELCIDSIEALEAAAESGQLQILPGFGLKTEQKILKAINSRRSFEGLFRLSIGKKAAMELTEYLKAVPGVTKVKTAGAVRRWKEVVEEVQIIALCTEPEPITEAFLSYGSVAEVVSGGDTGGSAVRLENGLPVHLLLVKHEEFASALLCSTGSKQHINALRARAQSAGLRLNEDGLFSKDGKKRITCATEEEVYGALGFSFIPPVLREDRGEIEAALKGELPRLIKREDLTGDLHCHTVASDGANTTEEMAEAAMALGYGYLAITDHSKTLTVAHGLDSVRLRRQIKEIEDYNKKLRADGKSFRVLKGTEVDILSDGSLDHPDELLKSLDIVVASVHSGFGMAEDKMTARVIRAIESGLVNIIAHPTGRLIGMRQPFEIDMAAVLKAAKAHGVAMEVNSYPERLDLNDAHLRLAKEVGVKVAISTDAHAFTQFGNIDYGLHTAQRGWVEPEMVINSLPLDGLLGFLANKG